MGRHCFLGLLTNSEVVWGGGVINLGNSRNSIIGSSRVLCLFWFSVRRFVMQPWRPASSRSCDLRFLMTFDIAHCHRLSPSTDSARPLGRNCSHLNEENDDGRANKKLLMSWPTRQQPTKRLVFFCVSVGSDLIVNHEIGDEDANASDSVLSCRVVWWAGPRLSVRMTFFFSSSGGDFRNLPSKEEA